MTIKNVVCIKNTNATTHIADGDLTVVSTATGSTAAEVAAALTQALQAIDITAATVVTVSYEGDTAPTRGQSLAPSNDVFQGA